MATPTNTPQQPELPATQSAAERSRRRVIQGGLAAAPLLMTLLSRPVLGAVPCTTCSGFVSLPTSTPRAPILCSGHTPEYWADPLNFGSWAATPYFPDTSTGTPPHTPTLFNFVFPSPQIYPSTTTLVDVLGAPVGPNDLVARYIVAALLNDAAGLAPPLPSNVVQGIWREYATSGGGASGFFEPTAGVQWFQADIVRYLQSTMTV